MSEVRPALSTIVDRHLNHARQDPEAFAAMNNVAHVLPTLVQDLGLGHFVETLVPDSKPRLVLRFRPGAGPAASRLGENVVLKVYGDRPRGEGPLQEVWRRRGVPTPRLFFGERGTCSWLVLEHLPMGFPMPSTLTDVMTVTDSLAAWGSVMHGEAPALDGVLRPLGTVMTPRLEAAAQTLVAAGYALPPQWRRRAYSAYQILPSRPLHGDLAVANLGRDASGSLVMFDASALAGTPAFDAARWAARMAAYGADPCAVLARWRRVETLDQPTNDLLAAECIIEAGAGQALVAEKGDLAADDSHRSAVRRLVCLVQVLLS